KQQLGGVRTSDQQHKSNCSHQHQQRCSHVADDLLVERHDFHADALIAVGVALLEPPGNCSHLDLCLVASHAGFEFCHHTELVIGSFFIDEIVAESHRPPKVGLC